MDCAMYVWEVLYFKFKCQNHLRVLDIEADWFLEVQSKHKLMFCQKLLVDTNMSVVIYSVEYDDQHYTLSHWSYRGSVSLKVREIKFMFFDRIYCTVVSLHKEL